MCSVLIVLVKLSVARKTPLRKPNHGEGIVSTKLRMKTVCDFLGLVYCFMCLFCRPVLSWVAIC